MFRRTTDGDAGYAVANAAGAAEGELVGKAIAVDEASPAMDVVDVPTICPRQYPRARPASMLPEEWERTFSAVGLRTEVTYRQLSPLELLLAEDVPSTSSREIYALAERLQEELRKVYGRWGSHTYLMERQRLLHSQAAAEDVRLRQAYDSVAKD